MKQKSSREQLELLVREVDTNISRASSGRSRYHQSAIKSVSSADHSKASIIAKDYGVATNELSSLLAQVQGSLDGLRHEVNNAQTLSDRTRAEGIQQRTPGTSGHHPSRPSSAPRMPRSMQESTPTATSILLRQRQPILIPHSLTNTMHSPSPSRYNDNPYKAEGDNESVSFAAHSLRDSVRIRDEFDATAHVSRALDSKIDEFEKRIQVQLTKAVASAVAPAPAPPPSLPPPPPPPPPPPVILGPSESLVFLSINKAESAERSVSDLKSKVMSLDHQSSRKQEDLDRRLTVLQEHQQEMLAKTKLALTRLESFQEDKGSREKFESDLSGKVESLISEAKVQISKETSKEVQSQVQDLSSQLTTIYAPRSELISGLARIEALAQKHDDISRESGRQSREMLAATSAVTSRTDTLSLRIDGLVSSVELIQRQQHELSLSQGQHEEAVQQVHHRLTAAEVTRSLPLAGPPAPPSLDTKHALDSLTRRISLLEDNREALNVNQASIALEPQIQKIVAAQMATSIKQKIADEDKISSLANKVSELESSLASALSALSSLQASSSAPPLPSVQSRGVAFNGGSNAEASKASETQANIKDIGDFMEKIDIAVQGNVLSIKDLKDFVMKHDSRIVAIERGVTNLWQNSLSRVEVIANEARLAVVEEMCRDAINDIDASKDKVEGEVEELKSTLIAVQAKVVDLQSTVQNQSIVNQPIATDALDHEAVEAILAASLIKHESQLEVTDKTAREALAGLRDIKSDLLVVQGEVRDQKSDLDQIKSDLVGVEGKIGEQEAVNKLAIEGLEIALGDLDHKIKDQGRDIGAIQRELSTQSASITLIAASSRDTSPAPLAPPPPASMASRSIASTPPPPPQSLAASIAAVIGGGDKGRPKEDVSEPSSPSASIDFIQPRNLLLTPKPSPLSIASLPPVTSPLVARELALMPEPQVPPPTSFSTVQSGPHARHTREFTPTPLCEEESDEVEEEEEDDFSLPPPPPSQPSSPPIISALPPSSTPMRETRDSLGLMEGEGGEDYDSDDGGVVFDDDDLLLLPGQDEEKTYLGQVEQKEDYEEEEEEGHEDKGSEDSLDISGEAEKLAFLLSSPAPSRSLPEPLPAPRGAYESPTKTTATTSGGGGKGDVIVGSLDYLSSDQESANDEEEERAADERARAALAKAGLTTAVATRAQGKAFEDSDEEVEVFKPLSKPSAPAPPLETPQGRYQLTIVTGSKNGAGMSNDLHLTLKGSMGSHDCIVKSREDGRIRFQRSSRDQVTITSPIELGAIQTISTWHQGEGFSSSWLLERVIIEHESSDQIWEFGINDWIRGGEGRGPKSYRQGAKTPMAMSRENSSSSLGRAMIKSPRVSADSVSAGRVTGGGGGRPSDSFDDDEDGFVNSLGLGLPSKAKPPAGGTAGVASLFSQPPSAPGGGGGGKGLVATGALSVPSVMGLVDDDDFADVEDALVLGGVGGGVGRTYPNPNPNSIPAVQGYSRVGLPPLSSPHEPSPGASKPPPPPSYLSRSQSRSSSQDKRSEDSEEGGLSYCNDSMDSLPGLGGGRGGGGQDKGKGKEGARRVSSDGGSSLSSLGSLRGGRQVYGEVVDKSPYGFRDEDEDEEEQEEVRPALTSLTSNYGGAIGSSAGGMRVWDGKSVVSTTIEIDQGPGFGVKGKTGWKNPLAEGDDD